MSTNKKIIKDQSAFSLLEMSISLIISMFLFAGIISFLNHTAGIHVKISKLYEELVATIRLKNILNKVIFDIDEHTFNILPQAHNKVVDIMDGSNAISSLKLDILNAHTVITYDRINEAYTACKKYENTSLFLLDKYNSYLGISVDGFVELVGENVKLIHTDNKKICRQFMLKKPQQGILFSEEPLINAASIQAIVPIIQNYTIYLNSKGELRYLGHKGNVISENQPLMSNIKNIIFTVKPVFKDRVVIIGARIEFEDNKEHEITVINQIARTHYYNFLMNI